MTGGFFSVAMRKKRVKRSQLSEKDRQKKLQESLRKQQEKRLKGTDSHRVSSSQRQHPVIGSKISYGGPNAPMVYQGMVVRILKQEF